MKLSATMHGERMPGKKGQITIFIIMGIVILAGAVLFLNLRKEAIGTELSAGIEETIEEVPIEFRPAASFVESCIRKTAEEGIKILGERGGFTNPIRYGITTKEKATESDAVKMSPGSDYSVPYWYYMRSPNSCTGACSYVSLPDNGLFLHKKEGDPSIEKQIEDYINENLNTCLAGFKTLEEQGFKVEEKGGISAKATILDKEVLILVEYPLEFTKEAKKQISRYFLRIPIDLNSIFSLAKELVDIQGRYRYLEKQMLNLMVGFSGVDSNKLPPLYQTALRFGGETAWAVEKVKLDIKNILSSYIQMIRVSNTYNYRPLFMLNSVSSGLYNSGMLVPLTKQYPSLEVSFRFYDWWPVYFEISCKGRVCRPESASANIMALIGIQKYEFLYDISFPVLVEIKDHSALNNRGYNFYFFMESNIRRNSVMEAGYIPFPMIDIGSSTYCNPDSRAADITINAFDSDNNRLNNAEVIYTCFDQSCSIGKVQGGVLDAKFPQCAGGVVSVIKEGYLGQSKPLDIKENTKKTVKFRLNQIYMMDFIVKKKLIKKEGGYWIPRMDIAELKPNEQAIVSIEKISSIEEEEFRTGGIYSLNQTEPSQIRIGAGEFMVNIHVLLDENITIPESEIEGSKIPAQTLPKPYPSGGIIANYTFNNHNLKTSNTIVFYALSPNIYDIPESQRDFEDLMMMNIEEYSKKYWYGAWPGFE